MTEDSEKKDPEQASQPPEPKKKRRTWTVRPDGISVHDTPSKEQSEPQRSPPLKADIARDARSVARRALGRVFADDAYADLALESELAKAQLSLVDVGLATELLMGTLRRLPQLDYVLTEVPKLTLETIPIKVVDILRLAVYQLLFLDRVPAYAVVNEAIKQTAALGYSRLKGMVNASLRRIDESKPPPFVLGGNQQEDLMNETALPQWLAFRWLKQFGYDDARKLGVLMLTPPPMTLRINTMRIKEEGLIKQLDKLGYKSTKPAEGLPILQLNKGVGITKTTAFTDGLFYIQDISALMAPLVLAPPPGATVLDLCCGLGGKTTFLAQLMNNQGSIIAVDSNSSKLRLLEENCSRLGITIVEKREGELGTVELPTADYVLLDVPCSNLGTVRRRPELKWKMTWQKLHEMIKLEAALLEKAAALVKPGGVLVYSTCTMEPEENEIAVEKFLKKHSEYTREDALEHLPQGLVESWQLSGPYVRTLPQKHGCDGAFVARLRRQQPSVD